MTTELTCEEVRRLSLVEKYVARSLDGKERDRFEEHLFSCASCVEEVGVLQAARRVLAATPRRSDRPSLRLLLAAAAAAVVVAAFLLRSLPIWTAKDAPMPPDSTPLARIEAPAYHPTTVRGNASDAGERFRTAMESYVTGEYETALPDLEAAFEAEPEADHGFFLGTTLLLLGRDEDGVSVLGEVVALGDTPFLEEALLYIAKSYGRRGEIEPARRELERVIEIRGDFEADARALIDAIDAGVEQQRP